MSNFYVNNEWFCTYHDARVYADQLRKEDGIYRVVYTRAEMDAVVKGMVDSVINHAEECGK